MSCSDFSVCVCSFFFFSSRRRHTSCALVTGVQTCALPIFLEARSQVAEFAQELSVGIDADIPGISGFTMAEPRALEEMLGAMLRVVLADTPRGEAVALKLEELEGRTRIRIAGGFGIAFERLVELLSGSPDEAVGDFKLVAEGMARALQ